MLITIEILSCEKINLMLFSKTTYFEACNINVSIEITPRGIYAKVEVYILLSERVSIDVGYLDLSKD